MKRIILFVFLFLSISISNSFSAVVNKNLDTIKGLSMRTIRANREAYLPLKHKKLTVFDYVFDPFFLYANLWVTFAATIPLWETNKISFVESGEQFTERFQMEPFATGRIESITKPLTDSNGRVQYDIYGNPIVVFTRDVYAKNIVEPVLFTQATLYLMAKNYNIGIIIAEIIGFSFLYEFTLRPLFMNSSFEQLIKNPVISLTAGILLDELSTFLLTTPYIPLHVLAYILNPFKALPSSKIRPLVIFTPYKEAVSIESVISIKF
jgi:hypothetical protein